MYHGGEALFTIGQFAKLHGINKKTLMWYDEVGIFKAAEVKENGYRYYTYYQSSQLETILMLRELDVSISEIRDFMENRCAERLEALLGEKIEELDSRIAHLKKVRKVLQSQQQDMRNLMGLDLEKISIVEKEKSYFATVATAADMPFEKEAELVVAETKKYQLHRLRDASYGAMISVEKLLQGEFGAYDALFIEIYDPIAKRGLHIQPKGRYLRAFCRGEWERLPERYREILRYAEEKGLILAGYAYETGINQMVIDTMEEYITQIEIPILG